MATLLTSNNSGPTWQHSYTEYKNVLAFAALRQDGSVFSWGPKMFGGDSSTVASSLLSGVSQIYSNQYSFAALKRDGRVVTWGHESYGGNSTAVDSFLRSGVAKISSSSSAFAAIKQNGSVITWGDPVNGGDSSSVSVELQSNVKEVYSTGSAFAALKGDGSVVTWGFIAGDSSAVRSSLRSGVRQICSTGTSFAALKDDGSVVTWGDSWGGDSSAVSGALLDNVKQIFAGQASFAALKNDGSVVTWGQAEGGGNSQSVASKLTGVTQIFSTASAFAALKQDGSVVTWGNPEMGGDSREVASQLARGIKQIFSTGSAFAAIKEDGSVVSWGGNIQQGYQASWDPSRGVTAVPVDSLRQGVKHIYTNYGAFAALKTDGTVICWGDRDRGGGGYFTGVKEIVSNQDHFAAIKRDGSVFTWYGSGANWIGNVEGVTLESNDQRKQGVISLADPSRDDRLIFDTLDPPVINGIGGSDQKVSAAPGDQTVFLTAQTGSTVKLYRGDTLLGTAQAVPGATGSFSYTLTAENLKQLGQGPYKSITAVAIDNRGVVSAASSPFYFSIYTNPKAILSSTSTTLQADQDTLILTDNKNISGIGNGRDNVIIGNQGNNALDGKDGVDRLTGMEGSDSFIFSTRPVFGIATADHITDFTAKENDKILINKSVFGISNTQALSFTTANSSDALQAALSSNRLFVYDTRDGNLFYNHNGSAPGYGLGGVFAILDDKASLGISNIGFL